MQIPARQAIPPASVRETQQSTYSMQNRMQRPTLNTQQTPNANAQLRPRFNQSPQIRPPFSSSNAPSMTPRSVTKQQGTPVSASNSVRPKINSAPPVEPPSDSYKDAEMREPTASTSEARPSHSVRPPFSQRGAGSGPRMPFGQGPPRPLMASGTGPNEARDLPFSNASAKIKLPSLIHQRQPPSNISHYKKTDCRHFPNCRYKHSCHNRHPPCPDTV